MKIPASIVQHHPGEIVILIPALLFIVGLLFLSKGGDWFVDGASALARRFHLPELLIGANVFILVLVSGVSVSLAPFTIPQCSTLFGINSSLVLDLPVMLLVMLILTVPALLKGKLSRAQGMILLAIYAAFCVVQFTL